MFERGGLVVLATLVTYVWLAPHAIMNGDNADLAGVGHVGGAAHPSGYPLYVMWLRLWSWLPGSPAYVGALAPTGSPLWSSAVDNIAQVFV